MAVTDVSVVRAGAVSEVVVIRVGRNAATVVNVGGNGTGGTSAVISPATPTQSLTPLYLLRVSADGTHVDQIDPTLIGGVTSVNTKTGAVVLTAADVSADPAGAATTAVANHAGLADPHAQYLQKTIATTTYAPIASPTFTGTPAAPTPTAGNNTTLIATTQFVQTALTTLNATNITTGTLADSRLTTNIPLIGASQNTFLGTLSTPKVSIPALVTGLTNPFIIRSNTGGTFTEPSHYLGIQGSETAGIAFRSNGQPQFMGQVSVGQFNDIQIGGTSAPYGFTRGTAQNVQLGGVADVTFDAGTGTSVSIGASATTSTTAKQSIWKQICSWLVNTQATRLGQIEEFIASYTGWQRSRRVYSDGTRAYTAFAAHTTAPADADLQASEWSVYTDGTGLFAKLKNASSTVYTISLAGGSYTLPTASGSTLGGVKVGSGLSIDGSGVLSATGGGGGGTANGRSWWDDTPVASYAAPVIVSARGSGTITGIYGAKTATGTVVVTLKINGTAVTGVNGVTLTSTLQNFSATGANTYVSGDRITLEYGSVTGSPTNLELTVGGV